MPIYDYEHCGQIWEGFNTIDERNMELCSCGEHATIVIRNSARPVIYEYYDTGLGAQVTGPKQRQKIMRAKGLEESG